MEAPLVRGTRGRDDQVPFYRCGPALCRLRHHGSASNAVRPRLRRSSSEGACAIGSASAHGRPKAQRALLLPEHQERSRPPLAAPTACPPVGSWPRPRRSPRLPRAAEQLPGPSLCATRLPGLDAASSQAPARNARRRPGHGGSRLCPVPSCEAARTVRVCVVQHLRRAGAPSRARIECRPCVKV